MKSIRALSLAVFLVACGGSADAPPVVTPPCEDAGAHKAEVPEARVPEVPEASVPEASAPCALRVDRVEVSPGARGKDPGSVLAGQALNAIVTVRGCGFAAVADVEVNVDSVGFAALDDETLVFELHALSEGTALPYAAAVDIIVKPATQVQTSIRYVSQ